MPGYKEKNMELHVINNGVYYTHAIFCGKQFENLDLRILFLSNELLFDFLRRKIRTDRMQCQMSLSTKNYL
jgi:hypothetical protein